MNFVIFKDIILNAILIIFPILIYLVVRCYYNNISKKNKETFLSFFLVTSIFLCLKYGFVEDNSQILLFLNIPIVIAYVNKSKKLAIFLSVMNIIYCFSQYNDIYIIVSIKYFLYFVTYLLFEKKKVDIDIFILIIATLQAFFLSFEYFFNDKNVDITNFVYLIVVVFIYYFITFFILYIFKTIDKIEKLNKTIILLRKDKKIKDALFKLTHEIKNPLAVCKGYLDMINLDNREKADKYILIMKQEINRSLNIISDFVELNKIKIAKEEIDLNILLEDVYETLKMLTDNKNINFVFSKSNLDENIISGDYDRLKQVMINLLKNSIEAIEGNGKIVVTINKNKSYYDIIIEDNGKGIDKNVLSKIKEMFYTTKNDGTGLGVSLSNEIIEAHNGKLIYESKVNIGTKSIVRLPY